MSFPKTYAIWVANHLIKIHFIQSWLTSRLVAMIGQSAFPGIESIQHKTQVASSNWFHSTRGSSSLWKYGFTSNHHSSETHRIPINSWFSSESYPIIPWPHLPGTNFSVQIPAHWTRSTWPELSWTGFLRPDLPVKSYPDVSFTGLSSTAPELPRSEFPWPDIPLTRILVIWSILPELPRSDLPGPSSSELANFAQSDSAPLAKTLYLRLLSMSTFKSTYVIFFSLWAVLRSPGVIKGQI